MRVAVTVPFVIECETPLPSIQDAVLHAVARVVRIDDLDLEVVTIEPLAALQRAVAQHVLTPPWVELDDDEVPDLTVSLVGPTADVQELVRRWEK